MTGLVRTPRLLPSLPLLLTLLPTLLVAQTNSLRVEFEDDPSRSTAIGLFQHQSVLYVSLSDLVHLLSLRTYENPATVKLEVRQPPYRLVFTGGSPYVVLIDQRGRRSVYQLGADAVYAAGAFFVPLESFSPLLETLLNSPAFYDRSRRTLRLGGGAVAARGYDIPALELAQKANGLLVRIRSSKPLPDYESWLRNDGWLYVTISDARADTAAINALTPVGIVKQILAIQSPTSVQLTFRLSGNVSTTEVLRDHTSNDLLLTIHTPARDDAAIGDVKPRPLQTELENQRKRWELDVIVIDPGHGGHDPGTIGVSGTKEKDIALGIALKLGQLIKKHFRDVKVVFTRSDDRFVPLDRRGQIANEAGGKLFISIHGNSMRRKPNPTRGFEVYLLRPGRTEEAIAIAELENSVITLEEGYEERYKELTEENFILVTMAQSAYMRASEVFADILQQEMENIPGLENRGVKQAGFYVLVGAAMPNVLIETAYLSNRSDERFLRSESGQRKIAESILRAIKRYKGEYEKLLMEGKDLGQNR